MEKLTRKQKLKLVREAKKDFIGLMKYNNSSGLCFSLERAYVKIWGEDVNYKALREDVLPEMVKYKPEGRGVSDSWWSYTNTEARIRTFNDLEQELLPWYIKVYNKLKNPLQ